MSADVWRMWLLRLYKQIFRLPSCCPSFGSEIPGGACILGFDIEGLDFVTDGCVKRSSRGRFFRGMA